MSKLNGKDISWRDQIGQEARLKKAINKYHNQRENLKAKQRMEIERYHASRQDNAHRLPIDTLMDLTGKEF